MFQITKTFCPCFMQITITSLVYNSYRKRKREIVLKIGRYGGITQHISLTIQFLLSRAKLNW